MQWLEHLTSLNSPLLCLACISSLKQFNDFDMLQIKTSFKFSEFVPTYPRTEEAKATTTGTHEAGNVTVNLCEMVGSNSCSVCATSTISEFTEVIFESYSNFVVQQELFQTYSQRIMKCLLSSQPVQVVKLGFNTNEIRPTEITIYGNGK